MSPAYARVRLKLPGGSRRTVVLEISRETPRLLTGWAVDRLGDRLGSETVRGHLYVVDQADIVKRTELRMNLTYGELEDAG